MNRQRLIDRDFDAEGSDRAQALALALAQTCDPGFLESLLRHKAALDEFGGQLYIAAAREKFDTDGNRTDGAGAYETFAYIFLYSEKVKIAGRLAETAEAEAAQAPTEAPEPEPSQPEESPADDG